MGHDLTAELGIYERTVTAVLNAKLLPVINDFLDSMERSLISRGIDASIYSSRRWRPDEPAGG